MAMKVVEGCQGSSREATGHFLCLICMRESNVSIEFLHTSFGILFTFVWLFVGQILVASR